MSSISASPRSPAAPLGRLAACALLLAAEYLLISWTCDASVLLRHDGWGRAVGHLGTLAPLLAIAGTAALLLEGRLLRRELAALALQPSAPAGPLLPLLHAAAFGALLLTSWRCFAPEGPAPDLGWLALWSGLACATFATAVRLALPGKGLLGCLRRSARALLVGGAVGLLAWAVALRAEDLWAPLGAGTVDAAVFLLEQVRDDVLRVPGTTHVEVADMRVRIAPECSGYQGLGLMAVFVSAYLVWRRRALRLPAALLLLPLAVAASWAANVVRIAALILVGVYVSPEAALGGFHAKAGWLMFCVLALGTVAAAERCPLVARQAEPAPAEETWNPTAAYLGPMMALIAAALCTGLFVPEGGVDLLYAVRLVAALAALGLAWRSLDGLRPSGAWGLSWEPLALGALAFVIWVAPEALSPPSASDVYPAQLAAASPGLALAWWVTRCLGLVLVIPIAEELAFRGFLLRWLTDRDFTAVSLRAFSGSACLLSSLAFGLLHQKWFVGVVVGVLYALAARRRGRLGDAIVAHAVTNALLGLFVLATGRWSLL